MLAGGEISNGSIVVCKGLLTKKIIASNVTVAGLPAMIKRHSAEWHI